MKHDELWNDTLETTLPDGWQSRSLAAMKRESARLRTRRHVTRASVGIAALFALAWMTWPKAERTLPWASATPETPPKPEVRYLSDAEFINRLRDAGIGVGIAGSGDEKQLLLVSHEGAIYRP